MAKNDTRTALITGASSGIGYEFSRLCAEHGHDVVLVARSKDRLNTIAADLSETYNVQATVIASDLAKPGAPEKLAQELKSAKINVDILINNAGFGLSKAFINADETTLTEMINLNVLALTELTRLLAPAMAKRTHGRILNVASLAAFFPLPNSAVYAATKAYVLSLSVALNEELKASGVTATALCPGPTATGFAASSGMGDPSTFGANAPTARAVAKEGYEAMMKGTPIVAAGTRNKAAAIASHFIPRALAARFAKRAGE